MSDHTINQTYTHLKLIRRIEELGRSIEQLAIVAYHYKPYRQQTLQCSELTDRIDKMDAAVFQVQQDYTFVRAAMSE